MRLLILTQKVAKNDPILGFFHRWIQEFAIHCEKVTVICLEMGTYNLPDNVKVLSLGKERGNSKFDQLLWFYQHIWDERKNYDAVFVHMNQEYVLLGGSIWKIWKKNIYLWRNHANGSFLTDIACRLSNKVFYTSPSSYTAKFNNSVQMPVGIDTDFFKPNTSIKRKSGSVLFLGRIAPVKKVKEFIWWLKDHPDFQKATIAGPTLSKDVKYEKEVRNMVKESMLGDKVVFVGPVTQEGALRLYREHEKYVNLTPAGSFDKTILEALACGMEVISDNPASQNITIEDHGLRLLAGKLFKIIKDGYR